MNIKARPEGQSSCGANKLRLKSKANPVSDPTGPHKVSCRKKGLEVNWMEIKEA